MKYSISINDEDYLKFNIFYIYHSKNGRRSIRTVQLVIPIFCVATILILLLTGAKPGLILTEAIVLAILSVVFFFRTPKFTEKNMRKNIERLRADGKLPYHAVSEIEFLDPILVERHEQGIFQLKYEDIENIYFENDYIYIFYSSMQALIVPCRCLGPDKERVVAFLREKQVKA